jgi:hypothetical protein
VVAGRLRWRACPPPSGRSRNPSLGCNIAPFPPAAGRTKAGWQPAARWWYPARSPGRRAGDSASADVAVRRSVTYDVPACGPCHHRGARSCHYGRSRRLATVTGSHGAYGSACCRCAPPSRRLGDVGAPPNRRPQADDRTSGSSCRQQPSPSGAPTCGVWGSRCRCRTAQVRWTRTRPVAPRTRTTKRPRPPTSTVRQPVLVRRNPSAAKLLSIAPSTATSRAVAFGR